MRVCKICGCSDMKACEGGCYWKTDDMCSKCFYKEIERIKKIAPKECPITRLPFGGLVISDDNKEVIPVYQVSPYTSYSLPWYCEEEKVFYRSVYDEDEGVWIEEAQEFISLDEIKEDFTKEEFEELKKYYGIKE